MVQRSRLKKTGQGEPGNRSAGNRRLICFCLFGLAGASGVCAAISVRSASFHDVLAVSKGRVSRPMGGRVWGLVPINAVTWSMWLVEFRGKGRVGCLLDCLYILALLVVSGWRAAGAWRLNPPRHQIVGCKEGKERSAQLLTGGFPSTGSLELQTLIFEQACGGGFGLCECVWVSGADFLGNWRKEKRRLKELLLMGCGWWNVVGWWASPSFHPGFSGVGGGVGCGALHGRLSSCGDRAEEKNEVPSSSREASAPSAGRRPCPVLLNTSPSDSATKYSSPGDPTCFLPLLCVFFLVCLRDFRWGSLRIEQARAVLTKLERKVKVFLSLAKDPLLKDTPRCGQNGIPLSFLSRQ